MVKNLSYTSYNLPLYDGKVLIAIRTYVRATCCVYDTFFVVTTTTVNKQTNTKYTTWRWQEEHKTHNTKNYIPSPRDKWLMKTNCGQKMPSDTYTPHQLLQHTANPCSAASCRARSHEKIINMSLRT